MESIKQETTSNKNYYDKLRTYDFLHKGMTYEEVVVAFDGETGKKHLPGATSQGERDYNDLHPTYKWNMYTEEVICHFSYDKFIYYFFINIIYFHF
ncbi:hypothetical protein [Bacillus multifaciens]|uniref:hypothetical protein n=1 Tax=Bacillus multifaciens TaxID=3068506 RepID=UPI00274148B8|nr:hypothetical protein [Bacillus sp. WLY-B-L8]